jgi:hypothetical protein
MLTMFAKSIVIEDAEVKFFKNFCSFSPTAISNTHIIPQIYCFIQFNTEDKIIYLLPLKNGASAHAFLTKLALKFNPKVLKESDLLSAGEIVFGQKNEVVAWCLKSGTYKEKLSLNDETLPEKTGLPLGTQCTVETWENRVSKDGFANKTFRSITL